MLVRHTLDEVADFVHHFLSTLGLYGDSFMRSRLIKTAYFLVPHTAWPLSRLQVSKKTASVDT